MAAAVKQKSRGRVFLSWSTNVEDVMTSEEVELRGNFSKRIAKVDVRGYGEVCESYICRDPDDCMWSSTVLTALYELASKCKRLKYRGASTVELAIKLLENGFSHILLYDADVEVEHLLKKRGLEILRTCKEKHAKLRIEKLDENKFYIGY